MLVFFCYEEVMHLKKTTKRIIIIGFIAGMLITSLSPVFADDNFEADEDKYITLCSSKTLSKYQQNTCKKFNKYLLQKGKNVKKDISKTKEKISETSDDIESIEKRIKKTEEEITGLQEEREAYIDSMGG